MKIIRLLYWTLLNKRARKGLPNQKDIIFAERFVRNHLDSIWGERFEHKVSKVHKGKLRYDAVIVLDKIEGDTYRIEFTKNLDEVQEIGPFKLH